MSNESSQPSTPLNSAVDLSVVRVLRTLDPIARSSRCEYFLAGATARDLILVNVHGNKDAADLYRLLTTYADAGNTDRLYDTELDLLEAAGFDMRLAGAELLGRDVAAICDARILHQVLSILAEEGNRERLVIDMVRSSTYAEATPFVERTLDALKRGLQRVL